MTALIAAGAVLLALVLLSLVKCGVDAAYSQQGFTWKVWVGPFAVLSSKKKKDPPGHDRKEPEKSGKPAFGKKPSLAYLRALAELGLRLLKRFFKSLRINCLRFHFRSAFDDPYDTAMAYGWAGMAMESLTAFAAGRIRRLDLHTELDFDSDQPEVDARIVVSARLGRLILLAVSALFGYWSIRRRAKDNLERESKHGKSVDR